MKSCGHCDSVEVTIYFCFKSRVQWCWFKQVINAGINHVNFINENNQGYELLSDDVRRRDRILLSSSSMSGSLLMLLN